MVESGEYCEVTCTLAAAGVPGKCTMHLFTQKSLLLNFANINILLTKKIAKSIHTVAITWWEIQVRVCASVVQLADADSAD